MKVGLMIPRFLAFALALTVGVIAPTILNVGVAPQHTMSVPQPEDGGWGCGGCKIESVPPYASQGAFSRPGTNPILIMSKPQSEYTDEARANEVEGTVRLRVTLLASGNVGGVEVVRGLPDGLTEQSMAAAKRIAFEPATVDGRPVSKRITVDYNFTIY